MRAPRLIPNIFTRRTLGDVLRGPYACPYCRKDVNAIVYIGHRDTRGVFACIPCAKDMGVEANS